MKDEGCMFRDCLMKDEECTFRDCLNGSLSLPCLVISTFSFAVVYIMTSR